MNLLFVSQNFPYPPYRDGAYLKAYNLIRYLAEYNNIFLITFCNPGDENYIDKIASFCVQIVTVPHINPNSNKWSRFKKLIHDVANPKRFDSPRMRHEITSGVRAWKPDLVHIDLPMMSQYWSAVDNLPRVIASHDVISLYAYKNYKAGKSLFSKAMWYWLYKQRTWIETHFYPNYNVCTVVSEEDKELLEKHCPFLPIEVIPNGVDIEYFSPEKIEQDNVNGRFSIGLFGGMDFKPNVDGISSRMLMPHCILLLKYIL
ncbi:MAG: hypothetical protein AMJ75_05575 [Phycisphaerae bacterium SM1_79]|nr:MAG: hypothetical protein AMJ75_05575 [Phycisphaerae bacterium SM1_79]